MNIENKNRRYSFSGSIRIFLGILFISFSLNTFAASAAPQEDFFVDAKYDLHSRSHIFAFKAFESENASLYLEQEYFNGLNPVQRQKVLSEIEDLAEEFDDTIYPTTRRIFGEEWKPGIDGKDKVVILLSQLSHNVGGYFNPNDEYAKDSVVGGRSNEREMVYLNLDFLAGDKIEGFLAHEFQHMIYWNEKYRVQGAAEDVWINEARSELASAIIEEYLQKNFSEGSLVVRKRDFLLNSRDSLVGWDNTNKDYASVSIFMQYMKERFGTDIFRQMNSGRKIGAYNLNYVLERDRNISLAQVFEDWTLANYLNDKRIDARYGYDNSNLKSEFNVVPDLIYDKDGDGKINLYSELENWSADYFKVDLSNVSPDTYIEIDFNGSDYGMFSFSMVVNYKNGTRKVETLALNSGQDAVKELFSDDGSISSIIFIPRSVNINEPLQNNQPKRYNFSMEIGFISPQKKVRPDGALIRFAGEEKVYLIEAGKKRWIADSATFTALGYEWSRIFLVNEAELSIYPEGEIIKKEAPAIIVKSLLKGSGPKVYVLENGVRRWIKDERTFVSLGYDWKDIVLLADPELMRYAEGEPLAVGAFSDGVLLKGSGPQVYLVEAGKKRWITTPQAFVRRGFSWSSIVQVPDRDLSSYITGLNIE